MPDRRAVPPGDYHPRANPFSHRRRTNAFYPLALTRDKPGELRAVLYHVLIIVGFEPGLPPPRRAGMRARERERDSEGRTAKDERDKSQPLKQPFRVIGQRAVLIAVH